MNQDRVLLFLGGVAMAIGAILLVWGWGSAGRLPLYDLQPGEVTTRFSPPAGPDELHQPAIALAYCNRIQARETQAWLAEQRRANEEQLRLPPLTKLWRRPRCLLPSGATHAVSSGYLLGADPLKALPAGTLKLGPAIEALEPRVRHALVSRRGELLYRVVMLRGHDGALVQRVVAHADLLEVLGAWWDRVREKLVEAGALKRPCVCPLHLGIVGSGMVFLLDNPDEPLFPPVVPAGSSSWRLLLDVGYTAPRTGVKKLQDGKPTLYEKHSTFPAAVDASLRAAVGAAPTTESYVGLLFQAHDPLKLGQRAVVEQLDDFVRYDWLDEAPAAPVAGGGGDEEDEDAERAAVERALENEARQLGPRLRAEEAVVLVVNLSRTQADTAVSRRVDSESFATCYFYCERLERAFLAHSAASVAPTPPAIRAPTAQERAEAEKKERLLKKREARRRRKAAAEEDEEDEEDTAEDL